METTKKEMCQEYLNEFSEEQCESLLFLLQMAQDSKDKGDIMRFVDLYHNVDSAKPQPWSDKMRNEMQVNPWMYVWSYKDTAVWGKPEHLYEHMIQKLCNDLRIV